MHQKGFITFVELLILVVIAIILFAIFAPMAGMTNPKQVVCTSVVDGSVIRSEPSSYWAHSSDSEAWDDNEKMGSFSPRQGDSCHLERVNR